MDNLSDQQVGDIFVGRVTNWKQIAGKNIAIAVQDRPQSGSHMQAILDTIQCFSSVAIMPKARPNERNVDLVYSMKSISGAIGFMPMSEAQLHRLKIVKLNEVASHSEHYKLGIGLGCVYKGTVPSEIAASMDFLKCESARQVLRRTGHTPTCSQQVILQAR